VIEMRRRAFFGILGATAVGWPFAAGAQQKAMLVIGYLSSDLPGPNNGPNAQCTVCRRVPSRAERYRLCRGREPLRSNTAGPRAVMIDFPDWSPIWSPARSI
jgi:hypothetical protein